MEYNVSEINDQYNFLIYDASFVGEPRNNTFLFVTQRAKRYMPNLNGVKECLVFYEEGMDIPEDLIQENLFVSAEDPQREYALFAKRFKEADKERKYTACNGYYVGENVVIGNNCKIGLNTVIDHDVVIGDNADIGNNCVIKNAVIGNDFICRDGVVIGTESFYMAEDKEGHPFVIPAFGRVLIQDKVHLGVNTIVERGFNSNTLIDSYVSIDGNVCVGHDDHLGEGVTITAGATLAGFVTVGEKTYIGMNATIKQRLTIGKNAKVGMGAVVMTGVKDGTTVIGNPAHKFEIN